MKRLRLLAAVTLLGASIDHAGAQASNPVVSDDKANTAMGSSALIGYSGEYNTAAGFAALNDNYNGTYNSAFGAYTLTNNRGGGSNNVAVGYYALASNTSGNDNTAVGTNSLPSSSTADYNTALGSSALYSNSSGAQNTASGYKALYSNTTGNNNTATGQGALFSNKTGGNNAALGLDALLDNTSGSGNSAVGNNALTANTTGTQNLALGASALDVNASGSSNIALGYAAGDLITKSNNIDIGSSGVAADTGVIRIGGAKQTATYVAGIWGNSLNGLPVIVDSSGKLGVASTSSERFKTDIAIMGSSTAMLERLRPVTFHYKRDPQGALQYGLIAEEVAKIYPDLAVRSESGEIAGVRMTNWRRCCSMRCSSSASRWRRNTSIL